MRKNGLVFFIFGMLALVIYGVVSLNKKAVVAEENDSDIVVEMPTPESTPVAPVNSSGLAGDNLAGAALDNSQDPLPTSAQWNQALKQMSRCLSMPESSVGDTGEVSAEMFRATMPTNFGDLIFQEEDWNEKNIRLPSGEKRRLLVQNFPGENGPRRSLKYMSVDESGALKDLPLESEQQNNPSDTLIASLEADGEVFSNTIAKKAFYQNGAELVMVERDGHLRSFEVTLDGRSFRCGDNLKSCECP